MEIGKTTIAILTGVIILLVGTVVVFNVADSDSRPEYVRGICVFVNGDGTDATYIQGALYDSAGNLLGTTNTYEIVEDSWNVLYCSSDIRIETKNTAFILAVQGDGGISVPCTGEDYISENSTYGSFPVDIIDTECTSDLSIYILYR